MSAVAPQRSRSGSLAAGVLAGCDRLAGRRAAPTFHFTDITGAEFARKLELPDVDGKPRTLADWKGKVTVVFFGYTQCPDVCPTTMAELAQIRKLARRRRRQAAERVRDDRPGARHARDPEGLRRQLRPRRRRPARQRRADRGRGQGVQGLLRQGRRASRPAATPWTTAPPRSSSTRPAACASSCPTAATRRVLAADLKQLAAGLIAKRPRGAGPLGGRGAKRGGSSPVQNGKTAPCGAVVGCVPLTRRARAPCASSSSPRPRSGGCARR